MGRLLIGELVEKVLFYFSLSFSGIFKRRKMNTNYHCNVFAGEEEVTARSTTPVEYPDPVLDAPELPESEVVALDMITSEPGEQLIMTPVEDSVPWCPTPHKRRSSRKRHAPPAIRAYANHAGHTTHASRGTKKRLQTKRTMQKKRRIPVKRRRLGRPPAISVAHNNHQQMNAPEPAAMTPESHHSTPKTSRMRSSARKRPAGSPAAAHRTRSNHSGSLNIPRTFIVTIDEVKGER